jgi:integrase/recombinase XerD
MISMTLAVSIATNLAPQADSDETLLRLWLHGRPASTSRCYARDWQAFAACTAKPLRAITLGDVQRYADTLASLAPATQARRLSVVKSLFSFATRLGYLPFNVAAAVKPPPIKNVLAERILPERAVHRMLALEPDPRNHALLRLLYAGGLRVSELCGLRWRDAREREDGFQLTVFGKGGKTRVILVAQQELWQQLGSLRGAAGQDEPIFRSRKGGPLTARQLERIVANAARCAGQAPGVSPHWLRHAAASHALDRGASIALVQAALGHASVATTGKYTHPRPRDSLAKYLAV